MDRRTSGHRPPPRRRGQGIDEAAHPGRTGLTAVGAHTATALGRRAWRPRSSSGWISSSADRLGLGHPAAARRRPPGRPPAPRRPGRARRRAAPPGRRAPDGLAAAPAAPAHPRAPTPAGAARPWVAKFSLFPREKASNITNNELARACARGELIDRLLADLNGEQAGSLTRPAGQHVTDQRHTSCGRASSLSALTEPADADAR
jgi:hypothetical protein